jgi:hypothetical protein
MCLLLILYRGLRLFIATADLHKIFIFTLPELILLANIGVLVIIIPILYTQRSLSGSLYFLGTVIVLTAVIEIFWNVSTAFFPLKTIFELIVVTGSILQFLYLLNIKKTAWPLKNFRIYQGVFILYSLSLLTKLISQFLLSFQDIFLYAMFGSYVFYIVCVVLSEGIFLAKFEQKTLTLVGIAVGAFLGLGFSFAMEKRALYRVIAESIFIESTNVEIVGIWNIEGVMLVLLTTTFFSFIVLLMLAFYKKTVEREIIMLVLMLGLVGSEISIGLLLFARIYGLNTLAFVGTTKNNFKAT